MKTTSPETTRRKFLHAAGAVTVGAGCASFTACDVPLQAQAWLPWGQQKGTELPPFSGPEGETVDLISHALSRLTWGATPGEYSRVAVLGKTAEACLAAFVEEQLTSNPLDPKTQSRDASYAARAVRSLESIQQPIGDLYDISPRQLNFELTQATLMRFVHSPHQLYEIMVSFWTDHFNIDNSKSECRWLKAWDDREVIRKHALGNFRELLKASALSPAMLFYLDGRANRKEKPDDKPNENYARELLELHTLGVTGGYTQQDVMEVSRCLTGWTVNGKERLPGDAKTKKAASTGGQFKNSLLCLVGLGGHTDPHWGLGRVHFVPDWHDTGAKTLLGQKISTGDPGGELDRVLDILMAHSATAKFIAIKLCRRFISDDPPAAAVEAVAKAFAASQGDIKSTLRALFKTVEFRTVRCNKLKRPLHWLVSALRATGSLTKAGSDTQNFLRRAGQMPFEYPTPDGYSDEAKDWYTGVLARWDWAMRFAQGKVSDSKFEATSFLKAAGGRRSAICHLLARQPLSHELAAFNEVAEGQPHSAAEFLGMVLASPGFQQY